MTRQLIPVSAAAPAPAARCNCAVCPWSKTNPDAFDPICEGQNDDCEYCGCGKAEPGSISKCGQCPMRCGSRHDIDDWMADVGTFSFDDLSWNDDQLEVPALPRYVPQVDTKELGQLNADLNWPAFAVGLRRVFSPVSWKILPGYSGVTANEALGLDVDVTTVLVGYGEDPLVEAFWTRRHAMFDALAAQQWGLVLAPNYSMYGNQPRTEHLLNFRRNIQIATEMRSNGINAVPNLYWFREEDLERTCSWLMDEEVPAAAINLQTFRTEADWQLAVSGLAYFSVFMPDDFRLVVTGSSRQDRISVIASLFEDRMTLIGSNALIYGRHGAVMGEEGREDVHARTEDAFAHNVRFYDNLIAESSGLSLAEIMDQLGR